MIFLHVISVTWVMVGNPAWAIPSQELHHNIEQRFRQAMQSQSEPDLTRRPVFAKDHGCLKARFVVNPKLKKKYRIGPFQKDWLPAWIRFSNDSNYAKDTPSTTLGMAIKLVGVPGKKLLDGAETAVTQDFLAQNHPTFFSNNAEDFWNLIRKKTKEETAEFDAKHPETKRVFDEMNQRVLLDPLDGQYWTPVPFAFAGGAVKYMIKPCVEADPKLVAQKPQTDFNFRRLNLIESLKNLARENKEACFTFWMQFRDPKTMSLEMASEKWSEEVSPFKHFATIYIPTQATINNIDHPVRKELCENLSMTGWHTADLEPLGSLNQARRPTYRAMAKERREANRVKDTSEPTELDLERLE